MNDIHFHTKILINPHDLDEDMLCYLKQNPDQKSSVQKVRELDKDISHALAVEVPEGLHARIMLKQSYLQIGAQLPAEQKTESHYAIMNNQQADNFIANPDQAGKTELENPQGPSRSQSSVKSPSSVWQNFSHWPVYAVAASVLAVSLLLPTQYSAERLHGEQMVQHILQHIKLDPELMASKTLPQQTQKMQQLFASVGATLQQPLEGMSYAGICDVEGYQGLHLVVQQQGQPVTVIVIPGMATQVAKAFESSGMHGELIPVAGAMVAIIGDSMQQVAMVEGLFLKSVKFV